MVPSSILSQNPASLMWGAVVPMKSSNIASWKAPLTIKRYIHEQHLFSMFCFESEFKRPLESWCHCFIKWRIIYKDPSAALHLMGCGDSNLAFIISLNLFGLQTVLGCAAKWYKSSLNLFTLGDSVMPGELVNLQKQNSNPEWKQG